MQLAALALLSSGLTALPAAAVNPCSGVRVGPEQVVVSDARRDQLGLHGWADTAYGVLPDGAGRYRFVAAAALVGPGQSLAVTRGSLDDPVSGGVQAMQPVIGVPSGYQYAGGGPLYRDPSSGLVLQMLHLEQYVTNGFYTSLHLGRFDPIAGRTTYIGKILTPDVDYGAVAARQVAADLGTPAFTVVDGYLHIHFPDYYIDAWGNYASTALSVARAPLSEVLAAASAGRVTPWHKYRDGAWDSPAIDGPSTDIRPGQRGAWHPNVVRSAAGGSVLVQGVSPREFVLSVSPDGITSWSAAVPLFRDPDRFNAYPTVVGTGADPSVVGDEFYVYYLQWETGTQDWNHARMMRRLVTCTAGRSLEPVALIRYTGDSYHRVTTAAVSERGMYPERTATWYLEAGEKPGTKPLYGCRLGQRDRFVSADPDCEGQAILHTEGWIYESPPPSPSVALYRCYLPSPGDHYLSVDPACETPAAVREGLVGYALASSKVAFSRFFDGTERWVTSHPVTSGYALDRRWFLEISSTPGTAALYGCSYSTPRGINHLISVDPGCEGLTRLGLEGWIHTAPPAGRPSVPLYRCYLPASYDHFLSDRLDCDAVPGAQRERLMGYAETN